MTKAVFTTKVVPGYNDLPEVRYHFPKTYLNYVRQAIGDYVIYYEPRRSTVELSSSGGRQAYFGVARVNAVIEDDAISDHYFAIIDSSSYLDFDRAVPFQEGGSYYESGLKKEDGSTNKGAFGRAVRLLSDQEFDQILKAGFAPILNDEVKPAFSPVSSLSEPEVEFERPMVEMMVSRPFRERSFMHNVRAAYSNRCAITGLRLINGGGRPEVQAAHIKPVVSNGPDSVRNGLALSGTVHWMFDRGLVSVSDDYKILVAKGHVPEDAERLLNKTGMINLPSDEASYPNAQYLRFHRDNIFKG